MSDCYMEMFWSIWIKQCGNIKVDLCNKYHCWIYFIWG